MSNAAVSVPGENGAAKSVRLPAMPGRQATGPQVDSGSAAYQAGYAAAQAAKSSGQFTARRADLIPRSTDEDP